LTFSTSPNILQIHKTNEADVHNINTSEIDSIVFYPPVTKADFYVGKYSEINTKVIFSDLSISYGNEGIWSWDFNGDGVEDANGKGDKNYIYDSTGVYTATLAVTDEFGTSIKIDTIRIFEELITDIDKNQYGVVKIGVQYWMAHNLATTRYNNGDTIPNITIDSIWHAQTEPAFCWLYNDSSEAVKNNYGALYNTFVAQTDSICPSGWHVPSDEEWNELEFYLARNGGNYDSTYYFGNNADTARSKIAKSLASRKSWNTYDLVDGAVGNDPSLNNSSGFSGNTVGSRAADGTFNSPGNGAGWWTSDYRVAHTIWYRDAEIDHRGSAWNWTIGFSIRCVKD
jgi:uncharacterized protein (TIGR02145 family)